MADKFMNDGYGYAQIELNNCAFRRDGRIEAQCKIADGIDYLENGMILAINDKDRTVEYPTAESNMFGLNYSAEHMYDERLAGGLSKFRLDKDTFLPRLGYLAVGDKFTTNAVVYDESLDLANLTEGTVCADDKGYIRIYSEAPDKAILGAPVLRIIDAKATMPNGAPAVKFRCIQA